jgi:hypothetical protein
LDRYELSVICHSESATRQIANTRGSDVEQRRSGTIARVTTLPRRPRSPRRKAVHWSCADRSSGGPVSALLYSGDRNEPPHIHVERDTHRAKFWLDPVRLARSGGFGAAELRELERLVIEHAQLLLGKWNEYFIDTD